MKFRWAVAIAVLVSAAATVACGGGGSGPAVTGPPSTAAATSPAMMNGQVTLTIPAQVTTSSTRRSQYISASVQSVGISVTSSFGTVGPIFENVAASSPMCSATSGGARTCTIPLVAPTGSVTFTFALYDAANGGGNLLGSGSVTQTIAFGTSFNVAVVVNGVVATVAIAVSPTALPAGTAGTATVTATAKDADGNTIIAPGSYATPIALTNSDTSGATTIAPSSLTAPGQTATLTYNGSGSAGKTATLGAQVPGIPASAITSTVFTVGSGAAPSPSPTASSTSGSSSCSAASTTLPGTYTDLITVGVYSGTTYTASTGQGQNQSIWETLNFTAATPAPSPTGTILTPTPAPSPTGTPQPVYLWSGMYQLQSGTSGCFTLITSQDGSPLRIYNGTNDQGVSGFAEGAPNISSSYNVTYVNSGSLTLTISNLSAGGGSGTTTLSNGDSGTIALGARFSSTLDEARKLIEQVRKGPSPL